MDAQNPDDHGLHLYSKAVVGRAQRRFWLATALCIVGVAGSLALIL
jgi:hypothetical protein